MAQQTINVGASPNDGTGTPLRTAFQYTNSNFTELYTATGPSGNNIVVPGNATITGDLTVDTNVLKVDTLNNRVGIGTLNAYGRLTVGVGSGLQAGTTTNVAAGLFDIDYATTGEIITRFSFVNSNGVTNASIDRLGNASLSDSGNLAFSTRSGSGSLTERYRIAADGVATWSNVGGVAGTAMTLNATGLGVGYTPSGSADKIGSAATLGVVATGATADLNFRNSSLTAIQRIRYTDGTGVLTIGSATGTAYQVELGGNTTTRAVTIDASSNVGIGVTSPANRLEVQEAGTGSGLGGIISSTATAGGNAGYIFRTGGTNRWSISLTGTAGSESLRFYDVNASTTRMTLDASGNLLVAGASAYIRAGGRTQIVGGSVVDINTVGNNVGIAFGGASSILPCDGSSSTTDGVANFGSASKRWNTIYASTGTINTSDQNEKQDIADLGDAEKRVAGKIKSLVKKYRFKDAVASKSENARIHVGWIAQDIQNAFSSEGLDASKYGVFCSDTWEENGVQKTRLGLRYDEVLAFVVSAI